MKATADTPTCGFLNQETVTVSDTVDRELLLKLIWLRAKEHINTNKTVLTQNPNLWDELQGIHMRETTDAYYHVYAIE